MGEQQRCMQINSPLVNAKPAISVRMAASICTLFAASAKNREATRLRPADKMPTELGAESVRRKNARVQKNEADFASLCKAKKASAEGVVVDPIRDPEPVLALGAKIGSQTLFG